MSVSMTDSMIQIEWQSG